VFGLIALSAALVLAMFAAFSALRSPRRLTALQEAAQAPPPPRLQAAPARELASVRAAAQGRLQGYGWTDRAAGLARIPIDRAMQLQARRGWSDQQDEARR
jgi:hypothetical protein